MKLKEKTDLELKTLARDYGSRLYYCSDTGEGRKIRKEIERTIKAIVNEGKKRGLDI